MKKAIALTLTLGIAALVVPTLAGAGQSATAKTYKLSAAMNTRQVVTLQGKPWKAPAAVANAKGTFTGTLDTKTRRLSWRVTYSGIGQPKLIAVRIIQGKPGKYGQIMVLPCGPCKPGGQSGVTKVAQRFVNDIVTGNSFVTVKTEKFPYGVIRGQIKAR